MALRFLARDRNAYLRESLVSSRVVLVVKNPPANAGDIRHVGCGFDS